MCYAGGDRYEFLKIFRLRPYIWPCDPKWPQMKKWSNNICRVGQSDEHTWVTGPCCIILRTWCVFGKKWPFWPLWPWMTFDEVKGHMIYAGWVIDHCDQVSLKSIKAARRYIRLYGWQKKEERKNHRKTEYRRMSCACIKNHRKTEYRRMWMRLYKKKKEETSKKQDPAAAPAG